MCLPLPEAYRSLPRPSSASDAKASAMHPYYLDTNFLVFDETSFNFPKCASSAEYVKELYLLKKSAFQFKFDFLK